MTTNYFKVRVLAAAIAIFSICSNAQRGLYIDENVPISFFGRVIDQSEQPVPNAKVSLLLVITHYAMNSGEQNVLVTQTDQNGDFTVTGQSGHALNVTAIEKDGYELSRKCQRDFVYGAPHTPPETSLEKPIVFKMWKKMSKEPLVSGTKTFKITPNGEPFTIDFLKHEEKLGVSPPGDIVLRINRPEKLMPGRKFDWSYSIEAIDGGIVRTNTDFLYRAPEVGYEPKYEFFSATTNARWAGWAKELFYIKSRGGQVFGALEIETSTDYDGDHAAFKIDYALNPSGSRNLER